MRSNNNKKLSPGVTNTSCMDYIVFSKQNVSPERTLLDRLVRFKLSLDVEF